MDTLKMVSLSGEWKIIKDEENSGKNNGWAKALPCGEIYDINVPEYIPNSQWPMHLSYSNLFPKYNGYVWYYKEFDSYPAVSENESLLVEFERVAYLCEVYVNGEYVGEHRHQEKAFSFDITDKVNKDGKNLIAVRCFEPRPIGEAIDGIRLCDIPNSCFAQTDAFVFGADEDGFCLECVGGILGSVHLTVVPKVRVSDVYVRSFWDSGDVCVYVEVTNSTDEAQTAKISVLLADKKSGTAVNELLGNFVVEPGVSEIELHGKIENHQLWELDAPFLYNAIASVNSNGHKMVQFGFKDFRIINGFYFLNGKRIFLKGAHSGISATTAISMKALGFNMIRTIARAFNEETLKICDEIGLLVMNAAATAWGMFLHENSRSQIEDYNVDMIKASRNHPSVVSYCLFNENRKQHKELFDFGKESLPKLRKYAPDSLFFLHSGRWDAEISVGSASNPGSDKWDTYLGPEGIEDYPNRELPMIFDGFYDGGVGDIHIYMQVPVSSETKNYLRQLGHGVNPIFVSESGIASQMDPMGDYLSNCNKKLSGAVTVELVKELWDETEEFLDFYDLRDVYPLSFDFARDTEKLNGAQRSLLYNIYRSNPMINGFSFTSFGVGNEGTLQGNNVIKDSLAYAIQQGHEPLRWSLFSSERCVYADKPFEIEAVLCNEDVLAPGKYNALAYIKGNEGCVWKKEFVIDYPAEGYGGMPPLAVSALKEQVTLPAGEYVFSARLTSGNVAYDGDLKITVSKPEYDDECEITVWGLSPKTTDFLNRCGINTIELCEDAISNPPSMVLVGNPENIDDEKLIYKLALLGSNIVFVDAAFLEKNDSILKKIAGESAYVRYVKSTIYHNDNISIKHPVFDNIKDAGVLDFDKFGIVYPEYIFSSVEKPSKTICASARLDISFIISGLTFGEYVSGNGRYVLNSFGIDKSIGEHPYADQMLLNLVSHYGTNSEEQC